MGVGDYRDCDRDVVVAKTRWSILESTEAEEATESIMTTALLGM